MEGIILLLLGLVTGSFLNVVIYRVPQNKSIVLPRSFCPNCGKTLRAYHNIPVLSYLALKGRCAFCKAPVSVRYPLVEILTGVTFYLAWQHFYNNPVYLLFALIFLSTLIALSFIDLQHMILPDGMTLGGALLFGIYAFFNPQIPWSNALLAGVCGALFFAALFFFYLKVRHIEGLGFGDVKLMLMLGFFLGAEKLTVAIMLASLSGLLIGLFFIVFRGKNLKLALPFGPFLSLGSYIALFWGKEILSSIQNIFRHAG